MFCDTSIKIDINNIYAILIQESQTIRLEICWGFLQLFFQGVVPCFLILYDFAAKIELNINSASSYVNIR